MDALRGFLRLFCEFTNLVGCKISNCECCRTRGTNGPPLGWPLHFCFLTRGKIPWETSVSESSSALICRSLYYNYSQFVLLFINVLIKPNHEITYIPLSPVLAYFGSSNLVLIILSSTSTSASSATNMHIAYFPIIHTIAKGYLEAIFAAALAQMEMEHNISVSRPEHVSPSISSWRDPVRLGTFRKLKQHVKFATVYVKSVKDRSNFCDS